MNAKNKLITSNPPIMAGTLNTTKVLLIEMLAVKDEHQLETKMLFQDVELVHTSEAVTGLVEKVQTFAPSLLMLSVDFLDAGMLEELIKVNQSQPLPVIVFAKRHSTDVAKTVVSAGVSSYVVDDVQAHRLPTIMDLAKVRFEQMHSLNTELVQTKAKLNERKLIERAKGIVMQQKQLTEDEAYVHIRKSAMNQGESMADLSEKIISVFNMLD